MGALRHKHSIEGKQTLSLQELLHALKPDITQTARYEAPKKHGTLYANVLFLTKHPEQRLREGPYQSHDSIQGGQDCQSTLQEDAEIMLVG